jgi:S1-C subfamily serine protease
MPSIRYNSPRIGLASIGSYLSHNVWRLAGSVDKYPLKGVSKLGKLKSRKVINNARLSVVALVVGLVLVACAGSAVPWKTGELEPDPTSLKARSFPVADITIAEDNPEGETPLQLDGLDADTIIAAQEQVLSGIYDRVVPSVVQIRTVSKVGQRESTPRFPEIPGFPFEQPPDLPGNPDESFEYRGGSGFVWDNQGRIVTNHHVIDGADRVTVVFNNHTELKAEILGSDPDSDLAVLQVEVNKTTMHPVGLGNSDGIQIGQMAAAIGNPFGQEFTITSGIISALGRTIRSGNSQFSIPHVIQTDAPINPGNSGGPLLDRHGQVIGVNTQIVSRSGASSGIGFAVPINAAKRVVPALIQEGRYEYAWLGISGTTLSPDAAELMNLPRETRGALVLEVNEEGPAQKGGLRGSERMVTQQGFDYRLGGDIIVAVNDTPIEGIDELIAYLIEDTRPGDEIAIEVIRGGENRETVTVTLGKRPNL